MGGMEPEPARRPVAAFWKQVTLAAVLLLIIVLATAMVRLLAAP
jgi:hypothetical protein